MTSVKTIAQRVALRKLIFEAANRRQRLNKFNKKGEWTAEDEAKYWREMCFQIADWWIESSEIKNH